MERRSYQIETLEHTADYGLKVTATTLEDAFIGSTFGLIEIIFEQQSDKSDQTNMIVIEADDIETLFVKWLNEIIYLIDGEDVIPVGMKILALNDNRLEVELYTRKINPDIDIMNHYVKAVTYYNLSINRLSENKYEISFFFDM